ncbi:hypothetical protein JOD97_002603 [Duganella sp. 1411]|uniref:hypothetical protein n=1 Tax=Duganella sp. 1411 TaxID=2806572 RepID=UPI001AE36726|nr:hypothetical protein [Duganella sp. 1411]MBP1204561.1 hypothetical protein [Duganella sp. 1411]
MSNLFQSAYASFSAAKLKDAQAVWINHAYIHQPEPGACPWQAFAARFAYMIPDGVSFDTLQFDQADRITLLAERYGGRGIADNGGGVRCGILGEFQIKGLGQNLLVGSGTDVAHSYGGLRAAAAVHEAVYSELLNRILPYGTARAWGIILTGPEAAYGAAPAREWGALLVRDNVIRPATFLRAPDYIASRPDALCMLSDVGRVRRLNRELKTNLDAIGGVGRFLLGFLAKCASQFAFARLARLMHGGVSPSNLSLDGRWLDMTSTVFLRSDQNNSGTTPVTFYEEIDTPVPVVVELASTYAKYNGCELQVAPLVEFYRARVRAEIDERMLYLFGLDVAGPFAAEHGADLALLRAAGWNLLSSAPPVRKDWPAALPDDDPLTLLVEGLFLSLVDRVRGMAKIGAALPLFDRSYALPDAFRALMEAGVASCAPTGMAIVAMKRARLPEFYFRYRMGDHVRAVIAGGDVAAVRVMLDRIHTVAGWAFDGWLDGRLTVCRGVDAELSLVTGGAYALAVGGAQRRFCRARDVRAALADGPPGAWTVEHHDFLPWIERTLELVQTLEEGA